MLQYLLDTNICIYLMKAQPDALVERFARFESGQVGISTVTWAELCHGAATPDEEDRMSTLLAHLSSRDFDLRAASVFGRLSRQFPARKGNFDRMIAAHAIALGVILVTNNTADFAMYQSAGLTLENWTAPPLGTTSV